MTAFSLLPVVACVLTTSVIGIGGSGTSSVSVPAWINALPTSGFGAKAIQSDLIGLFAESAQGPSQLSTLTLLLLEACISSFLPSARMKTKS